jgi:hypothetical protein
MFRAVPFFSAVLVLLLSALAQAQSGPDDLWEVTANITLDGLRLPGAPSKVCSKSKQIDRMMPMEEDCKSNNIKTSGNRTTFQVKCTGKDPMNGSGEITTGKDSYRGVLRLSGIVDGEKATMMTEYTGKRIGKCTAK